MNILVMLRAVQDPSGLTVNRKAQKVFVNHERFILNPSDRNALELALQLAGPPDSVTAIACGGEVAREVLQQARATGASRAIWVPTAAAAGLDATAVTKVLQHVVGRLGQVDLVLLGANVLDADLAQVGARLAPALDWPFVGDCYRVTTLLEGGLGLVVASSGGSFRLLGLDTPAVATVAQDCNQPRFPPAAQIVTVYQDPAAVEVWPLAELGLDDTALKPLTTVRGESFPPERTLGRLVEGTAAVREFVAALRGS